MAESGSGFNEGARRNGAVFKASSDQRDSRLGGVWNQEHRPGILVGYCSFVEDSLNMIHAAHVPCDFVHPGRASLWNVNVFQLAQQLKFCPSRTPSGDPLAEDTLCALPKSFSVAPGSQDASLRRLRAFQAQTYRSGRTIRLGVRDNDLEVIHRVVSAANVHRSHR
jgi:hypothetical protein